MKEIHNSQSIRKKDQFSAMNDFNLNLSDNLLLSLINSYITLNGSFNLSSPEIEEKWNLFSQSNANKCLKRLELNGYIKVVSSGDLFNRSRIIDTVDSNGKVMPKKKSLENDKKRELFDELWIIYNKKQGKKKSLDKFIKMKLDDCIKSIGAAKVYVSSTPDVSFRKHLASWLNGEHFNDELSNVKPVGYQSVVSAPERSKKEIEELIEYNKKRDRQEESRRNRTNLYGWVRPFPSGADSRINQIKIKSGGADDIEAVLTARLKREGKQYKK